MILAELKLPDDVEVFLDGEHVSVELQEEIKAYDRECLEVKHRIQHSKQLIGQTKKALPKIDGQTIDQVHIREMKKLAHLEDEPVRDEFVDAEVYMFCLALKDYGADFDKIALILRAKTPAVLRNGGEHTFKTQMYNHFTPWYEISSYLM